MSEYFYLLLCALTVFRLSMLVSSELGPGRIFQKLRLFLKKEAKTNKAVQITAIHRGVECFLCDSVWFSAPIAVFYIYKTQLPEWIQTFGFWFFLWNSLSSVAILLKLKFAKGF